MIKVQSHGDPYRVHNPARRGESNIMQDIVWIEEGRSGANAGLNKSSAVLTRLLGEETGLPQVRTHTQPVLQAIASKFPVGKEFPGHINRVLHSFPQTEQQVGRAPRMIDGKPTFFLTELDDVVEEDADNRLPNDVVAKIHPEYFDIATVRNAEVEVLSLEEAEALGSLPSTKAKRGQNK